jgi:hypothetical protein
VRVRVIRSNRMLFRRKKPNLDAVERNETTHGRVAGR